MRELWMLLLFAVPAAAQVPAVGLAKAATPDTELRSKTVQTNTGALVIEVLPSAETAARAIHDERARYYARMSGKPDQMAVSDASMQASSPESSLYIRLDDRGQLLGGLQETGDRYQPLKIVLFELGRSPNARIVIAGAKDKGTRALAVTAYDSAGRLRSVLTVKALNFSSIELE